MQKSVCAGCGATFTSVTAFDLHRAGEYERWSSPPASEPANHAATKTATRAARPSSHARHASQGARFAQPGATIRHPSTRRCLTPQEMEARGMERNARGHWTTGEHMPSGVFTARGEGAA